MPAIYQMDGFYRSICHGMGRVLVIIPLLLVNSSLWAQSNFDGDDTGQPQAYRLPFYEDPLPVFVPIEVPAPIFQFVKVEPTMLDRGTTKLATKAQPKKRVRPKPAHPKTSVLPIVKVEANSNINGWSQVLALCPGSQKSSEGADIFLNGVCRFDVRTWQVAEHWDRYNFSSLMRLSLDVSTDKGRTVQLNKTEQGAGGATDCPRIVQVVEKYEIPFHITCADAGNYKKTFVDFCKEQGQFGTNQWERYKVSDYFIEGTEQTLCERAAKWAQQSK